MSLLDTIRQRFEPERWRQFRVPAWGKPEIPAALDANGAVVTPAVPAEPLLITYLPVTLDDWDVLHTLKDVTTPAQAARMVALKACDAEHNRLFKVMDAGDLRKVADPDVVMGIFRAMTADLSVEQAAKN